MTDDLTYSDGAMAILAEFNNVTPEAMRKIWPAASNPGMKAWLELAANYRAAGGEPFHGPRYLKTPTEIANSVPRIEIVENSQK